MMSDENENSKKTHKRRVTTLILLVMFIFGILFFSAAIAGLISYFLLEIRILPPLLENRFPFILLFMFLVILLIGTIMAAIGGEYFLRPLIRLTEATKEVAKGNFDVTVNVNSSFEINRLATSFNEMTKELSSIETLRNDFTNNISHEFKTPVVSIRGFAKRLKKDSLTAEQRNEYLDIIISESERLAKLSANVLLLSKLESTSHITEKKRYSLDEQIRRSILILDPHLTKKQQNIEVELKSVMITSNEELMQHVWINLLNNASKFSPEGGLIKVKLISDADKATIQIKDSGVGMDENVQRHIFEKFYQEDKSRSMEGNGLGLSLVKLILDLCGGSIEVKSIIGEGSVFIITLPNI